MKSIVIRFNRLIPISMVIVFFATMSGCRKNCFPNDNCTLEPEAGQCQALIYKYYYSKTERRCKEFLWGGCDGVVPFHTLEECQECECTNL